MKQTAQFACGLAWVSCFPDAVAAASAGNPAYFMLGAAAAMLPGFADAHLRGLFHHDMEIVPDPAAPDPAATAAALAAAIETSAASGNPLGIRLHPARVGDDAWLCQEVFFDTRLRSVSAAFGPVVDGWNQPLGGQPGLPAPCRRGFRPLLRLRDRARLSVRGRDDVVIRMEPSPDGTLAVRVARRHWSLKAGLAAALAAGLALAAAAGPVAGAAGGGALAIGILLHGAHGLPAGLRSVLAGRPPRAPDSREDGAAHSTPVACLACALLLWNLHSAAAPAREKLRAARVMATAAAVHFAGALALRRLSAGAARPSKTEGTAR